MFDLCAYNLLVAQGHGRRASFVLFAVTVVEGAARPRLGTRRCGRLSNGEVGRQKVSIGSQVQRKVLVEGMK